MSDLHRVTGTWATRAAAAVALAAACTVGTVRGGEPLSITRLYGAGVHAYFSGDYLRSYEDLTATIEAGSTDPRTRYFRGLAALGLGRLDEAEADFSEGAVLEARAEGSWPVSRSLERVQGQQRFQLERHRARARVAVLERRRIMERERFLETQAAQPDVQRRRAPTGQPSRTDEPSNPFAPDSTDAPDVPPAEPPTTSEEMPPPVKEEPAPTPSGDDPFGNAPQSEPDMPAGADPAAPVNPGPSPAGDDPFGDATQPQPQLPAELVPGAPEGAAPAAGGE